VRTTGVIFALLVVAHLLRMYQEPQFVGDPYYLGITAIAAALAVWAWRTQRDRITPP
jgi:hypothetical protein